jgi:hypothetical protein
MTGVTVRRLSGPEILDVWERGQALHPVDRALLILATACPEAGWSRLAALAVGRRDTLLFQARARAFGPSLTGHADCPACGERSELRIETTDLGVRSEGAGPPAIGEAGDDAGAHTAAHLAVLDGLDVRFRLPDSRDLAAIAEAADPTVARARLLERCVLAVVDRHDGAAVGIAGLSPEHVEALAARMAEADPLAEVVLRLTCPGCGHQWRADLDIGAFFWTEIVAEARRLLGEVAALARAYGWREFDILAMGAARRRAYLELAAG